MKYVLDKNRLLLLCLAMVLIISGCSPIKTTNNLEIQEGNIEKHLSYFTANELEGRLIGSEGNRLAINYIENYFEEIGISPMEGGGFQTIQPEVGNAVFHVKDQNGNVIKTYENMKDFRVPLDGLSVGGTFVGETTYVTDHMDLLGTDDRFENLAVLIDYQDPIIQRLNRTPAEIDDRLHSEKAAVVIYPETESVNQHNINLGRKLNSIPERGILKIGVTHDIFQELINFNRQGYSVDVETSMTFNTVTSSNVLGVIPGNSKQYERYIILATSIDGLGKDAMGNIYPSATDNAASLALLLELAREMKESDLQLDATVVFLAYNGKHIGKVGLESYFANPIAEGGKTQVILLDEFSGGTGEPLRVSTFQNPNAKRKRSLSLVNRLALLGEEMKIDVEVGNNGTPSLLEFRKRGIPAVVLTEERNNFIGTPYDSIDVVNIDEVKVLGDLLLSYAQAYGNINLIGEIFAVLSRVWWIILLFALVIFAKVYGGKKSLDNKLVNPLVGKVMNYPIITIALIAVLFSSILVLQTWYVEMDIQGVAETQVNLSIITLLHHLLLNVPAMLVMGLYFSANLIYLGLMAVIIRQFFDRVSNSLYLIILSITGGVSFYFAFRLMYHPQANVLIPDLLSPENALVVIPILFAGISLILTWVYQQESLKWHGAPMSKMKILAFYILTLFIVAIVLYGPYLASKEISELRSMGRGVLF